MAIAQGSFASLHPYQIPGIRRLADISEVNLRVNPSDVKLQELFNVWGSKTAFVKNAPGVARALGLDGSSLPDEEILDLLEDTGTLGQIELRNLRDFYTPAPNTGLVAIVTGATARWMEYRIKELVKYSNAGYRFEKVIALASNERPCDLESEVIHPAVQSLTVRGKPPLENAVLKKLLNDAQIKVDIVIDGKSLEANVSQLITAMPELANARLYTPVNGNATYIALAIRRYIRQSQPSFDHGYDQFLLSQWGIPLARTPEQAADPLHYQHPLTMFSGLVRLMYELYWLNRGY